MWYTTNVAVESASDCGSGGSDGGEVVATVIVAGAGVGVMGMKMLW